MRTEDLVERLAAQGGAVAPHPIARRYAAALGPGALAALLLMTILLGTRPDLQEAIHLPMFWIKLAFPAAVAAIALAGGLRLARPGRLLGIAPLALILPLAAIWLMAAWELGHATAPERGYLVFGGSWQTCSLNIALLSAPILVAAFWAMRGFAPTRLALAGAASGAIAGALAAFVYALHCTEMAATFVGIWYVVGMLIPAAVGALLGPRLLRW